LGMWDGARAGAGSYHGLEDWEVILLMEGWNVKEGMDS